MPTGQKHSIAMIFGIILIMVLFAYSMSLRPSGQNSSVPIGGPFTLQNPKGETVTYDSLKGKLKLIYFGFTFCPDICPTDVGVLSQTLTELGDDAAKVHALFITVDPARDTPEKMGQYLSSFHPHIIGLTGTQQQVDEAIASFRVYAQKVEQKELNGYTMDHSAYFYLMDKDGKYITHFQHNANPAEMAAAIRQHL